jgi:hypothetical protein
MGQTYLADDYIQLTPVTTVATYNSLPAANSVTPYTDRVLVRDSGLEFFSDGTSWVSISGKAAQPNLTTGTDNLGYGLEALKNTTTGSRNISIGNMAARYTTTGQQNTSVGHGTLTNNTVTGGNNTALGVYAAASISSGSHNVAVGANSLLVTAGSSYNVAIGSGSLSANTASNQVAVGYQAIAANTIGASLTAVGYQALSNSGRNVAATALVSGVTYVIASTGTGTVWTDGNATDGNVGTSFTYNGTPLSGTGTANISGADSNTAVGYTALTSCLSGKHNTAVGATAGISITTANNNAAFGSSCLRNTSTGGSNAAFGLSAMYYNTISSNNTAVGYQSLFNNGKVVTSGSFVQGVTYVIATLGSTVTDFMALGAASNTVGLSFTCGAATQTGNGTAYISGANNNTAVGYLALNANLSYSNCTGLGVNSAVTGSNQVQLGDSATTTYAYGAVQARSDERDKADIRPCSLGLEFINKVNFVDYRWDKREDYRPEIPVKPDYPPQGDLSDEEFEVVKAEVDAVFEPVLNAWLEAVKLENITHDGTHKRSRYHHGVIAQQLKSVLDELGTDFGGFQNHKLKGGDDVLSVGYEEFIAPMGKAIQQLAADIAAIKAHLELS